jgi:hypothetical protein
VDKKEPTRPSVVRKLVLIPTRIIDVSPSLIRGVCSCVVESNREHDSSILLCRECIRSPIPSGDLFAGVELVDFRAPRVEMERQDVRVGIDLDIKRSVEGEVCREDPESWGWCICQRRVPKWCFRVVTETWDSRDSNRKDDAHTVEKCQRPTLDPHPNWTHMQHRAKMVQTIALRVPHPPQRPTWSRFHALKASLRFSRFSSRLPFFVIAFNSSARHSAPNAGTVTSSTGCPSAVWIPWTAGSPFKLVGVPMG